MRHDSPRGASRALFGFVLWALGGCTFSVDIRPAEAVKADAGTPKKDAGTAHDAGPDADSGEEDAGIVLVGLKHASCKQAFPAHIPGLPELRTDATGRPTFDLWRDLDCTKLDYGCHDDGFGISCGLCGDNGDEPRCYPEEAETECQLGKVPDQIAMGYGDGKCAACTTRVEKARACCKHTKGVDCRPWPFMRDSGVHQLCARHEDCQPGLVCKGGEKRGNYGLCLCPETDIKQATEGDACKQAFP